MKKYKELVVWQRGIQLVKKVYGLTLNFPKEEQYGLADQLRRAVVSIPSNIAEGHDRNSDKEFSQFLSIAKGSLAEVDTQIVIAYELGYITQETAENISDECEQIRKMISVLKITLCK